MMAATPITKYFMGCKDDIPFFFVARCSATVRCAGVGDGNVSAYIYI